MIDTLNDFFTGKLKSERVSRIVKNVNRLLEHARLKGLPVVYVCDSHLPNIDREFELWGPHAVEGTKGAEIIPELAPAKGDFVVKKRRYSGFFETGLDSLLRELKVDTLILTGILTNICVLCTAADAFYRNFKIVIPTDCVEALTGEEQKDGLNYMGKIFAAQMTTVEKLLKEL